MAFDLKEMVAARLGENYELHERHLNRTLVAAQRVIGFDKVYARAEGAYLYDMDNAAVSRFPERLQRFQYRAQSSRGAKSDPRRARSRSAQHGADGLLAPQRPPRRSAHEADAAASRRGFLLQLRHGSDGRRAQVCPRRHRPDSACFRSTSAFHGLSLGSLSLMGCESFTEGFGPLMDGFDDAHRAR